MILLLDDPLCAREWLNRISTNCKIPYVSFVDGEKFRPQAITGIYCEFAQKLSGDYLKNYPKLRGLAIPTTSLSHVDLSFCQANSINIFSLKYHYRAISEFTATVEITFWLILDLMRKASRAQDSLRNQIWSRKSFIGNTLQGKQIGVLGYGRLGKKVASLAHSFGMVVRVFDINSDQYIDAPPYVHVANSKEELFSNSDIITLHVDDRPSNEKLVNGNLIRYATRAPILINTSRGNIVDELELVNGMHDGFISGFGADVLRGEGVEDTRDDWLERSALFASFHLRNLNISLTPHIGGATVETMSHASSLVIQDLFNFLKRPQG